MLKSPILKLRNWNITLCTIFTPFTHQIKVRTRNTSVENDILLFEYMFDIYDIVDTYSWPPGRRATKWSVHMNDDRANVQKYDFFKKYCSIIARSCEESKPQERQFKSLYRFAIGQEHRQQCCREACQIPKRSDNYKYKSHGFEDSRDLTIRRLIGYWNGACCYQSQYPHLM